MMFAKKRCVRSLTSSHIYVLIHTFKFKSAKKRYCSETRCRIIKTVAIKCVRLIPIVFFTTFAAYLPFQYCLIQCVLKSPTLIINANTILGKKV